MSPLSPLCNTKGQTHSTLSNRPWLAETRQYSSSWGEPLFCFVNSTAIILPLPTNNTHTRPRLTHHLALSVTPVIVSHKQSCYSEAEQLAYWWSHMLNKLWASGKKWSSLRCKHLTDKPHFSWCGKNKIKALSDPGSDFREQAWLSEFLLLGCWHVLISFFLTDFLSLNCIK